jgi:hypothetical protein
MIRRFFVRAAPSRTIPRRPNSLISQQVGYEQSTGFPSREIETTAGFAPPFWCRIRTAILGKIRN